MRSSCDFPGSSENAAGVMEVICSLPASSTEPVPVKLAVVLRTLVTVRYSTVGVPAVRLGSAMDGRLRLVALQGFG
jgi:hypothetical protein